MKKMVAVGEFKKVPESQWPLKPHDLKRRNVWISGYFLVQEFLEDDDVIRLSINITSIGKSGRWKDGITWDALQLIKAAVGYSERDAVEVFPRDFDVVDVANMRHLWILPEPIPFAWRNSR